jgi:hypothetical protein
MHTPSHPYLEFPAAAHPGFLGSPLLAPVEALFGLVVSWDLFLLLGEFLVVLALLAGATRLLPPSPAVAPQAELASFAQQAGLSLTELGTLLTGALGLLALDLVAATTEDDTAEALSLGLLGLVLGTAALLGATLLLQLFAAFAIFGGATLARVIVADLLNAGLGLLRVASCVVRFVFYDLQGEVLDLAFHGTDLEDLGLADVPSLPLTLLVVFLDLGALLVQALLALAKLGLALFLSWLILDTFLLRPLALREARRPWVS